MRNPSNAIGFLAFVLLCAGLFSGCTQDAPYHSLPGKAGNCIDPSLREDCRQAVYQEHQYFDLVFAEYSDYGDLMLSPENYGHILGRLGRMANDRGVVLVVYVHDWNHSASEEDTDLRNFKTMMQEVGENLRRRLGEGALGERDLVGLYVGWRGTSTNIPLIKQATFWNRKNVADEIGNWGFTRLLLELEELTESDGKNVMITIGHGMGGSIVMSGLYNVLLDRIINRQFRTNFVRALGDGVLLINPVIEAKRMLPLLEVATLWGYRPEQAPLLISLSSDADSFTHQTLPAMQAFAHMLSPGSSSVGGLQYCDRSAPGRILDMPSRYLDTTMAGNFAPFLTHRLTHQDDGERGRFSMISCDASPTHCAPFGWTSLEGLPTICNPPVNYPIYFIKTDESLMAGHHDIFNSKVQAVLMTVIDDVTGRSLSPRLRDEKASGPRYRTSILSQPSRFEARAQAILESAQQTAR